MYQPYEQGENYNKGKLAVSDNGIYLIDIWLKNLINLQLLGSPSTVFTYLLFVRIYFLFHYMPADLDCQLNLVKIYISTP